MMAQNIASKQKTFQKPRRFFEKSGFVDPEMSFYIPLKNVVNTDKQNIQTMIDQGRYLSIFAPRQSGKTTFLEETCGQLLHDPTYVVINLSFEQTSSLTGSQFYTLLEKAIYAQLLNRLKEVGCHKMEEVQIFLNSHRLVDHISFTFLFERLNQIIQFKKIVIFIDEFDGIPLLELGDFLTSLRGLYQKYKKVKPKALYSVGLIGIRNITKLVVGGVSPFNIADRVALPPFSLDNIAALYGQYTEETNQPFTAQAIQRVYEETAGQPWLVNRLGAILTLDIKPETIEPINNQDVEKAIQILLQERNDHFDNLFEKAKLYKETFVEIVFDHVEYNPYDGEQSWLEQYGLIKNRDGHATVANNIYKSILVKAFFKEVNAGYRGDYRGLSGGF